MSVHCAFKCCCRRPTLSRMPESVWKRVVMFLVKRHELYLNSDCSRLPKETQVEHIFPRRPKRNCWQEWTSERKLDSPCLIDVQLLLAALPSTCWYVASEHYRWLVLLAFAFCLLKILLWPAFSLARKPVLRT